MEKSKPTCDLIQSTHTHEPISIYDSIHQTVSIFYQNQSDENSTAQHSRPSYDGALCTWIKYVWSVATQFPPCAFCVAWQFHATLLIVADQSV